ncbi:MAG: alpha/beta hydrolase [Betaproteobacteria bacterium]|nr:alpha/beta hydrolase [Betaproteobacteria bacterium]
MDAARRTFIQGLAGSMAGLLSPASRGAPVAIKASADAEGPQQVIDLWPEGSIAKPASTLVESVVERSTDASIRDRHVAGVTRPRVCVFKAEKPNGASILIMPGGGYRWVVIDREGFEMARWFAARGVTAFVLFYRLPGDGWPAGPNVALLDAQRAMRTIRHHAKAFGLEAGRVAAMGFSAGGHLCADLMTRHAQRVQAPVDGIDALDARPFLAAPLYPVVSMSAPHAHTGSRERLVGKDASPELERKHSPHLQVARDNCPVFLLHTEDDKSVPVENTLLLRAALAQHGVTAETHLFTRGGHGFGLRKAAGLPVEAWPDLFLAWARSQGWI